MLDSVIKYTEGRNIPGLLLFIDFEKAFDTLESVILIETFGNISGLRLNIKKTEALWIGSKKDCDLKLLPEKDFKWPKKKVKALGVWLSTDPNIITSLNYNEKIEKFRSIRLSRRWT